MAETLVEGFFRAESGNANDRPIDMEPRLVELDGERDADLEVILRRIGGGPGSGRVAKKRMKFEWRNLRKVPVTAKVTVVDAVGQAHIEIDNFAYVHRDQLMQNTRTKEVYVANFDAAVAPDATVDIISYTSLMSGGAGTLKVATAVGDTIIILPEAHAEGEEFPEAWRMQSEDAYDYIMEIARRSADISNIAIAEETYDPRGQRALDNKYAMIEMMEGIARLLWVSQSTREVTTASGARRHAMGGLIQKIVTNKAALANNAALTPALVGELLRKTKIHTSSSMGKLAVAGQNAIAAVSAWPVNSIQVSPREKEWGFDVRRIITPYGNLDLVHDKFLTAEYAMADYMAILDTANIRSVYLQTLGMRVLQKLSSLSTAFRVVDGVTTTFGMELHNEQNFALLTNIQ